ncbi:DUF4314 domain-containing protein [Vibrio sp. 10N.261.52.A1]|uniref:DUF4314 domain-containing protein n=1 Tax=Vibrio TaxID=662 RepID=UPI000CACA15A|nr:DUF4314 domain-containing protein [Vibrio sp. 10N.261.52.A1]PML50600.1 hypothetical protein BCT81_11090 [Vibrio sp. 10N.261.52.A1]
MRNSIIDAALANYTSSMTRYICNDNPLDLQIAQCAVLWINASLELTGREHFRTTSNGLLDVPFLLDSKYHDNFATDCWFLAETLFVPTTETIKQSLKPGDVIKMIHMNDIDPIDAGELGQIKRIDDMGTLHMQWDNGRSLGICMPAGDLFEVYYAS